MKKTIISQNFNSWLPINTEINQSEKIKLFATYIKDKYTNLAEVIAINVQEFIGGKNGGTCKNWRKHSIILLKCSPHGGSIT